MTDDRENALCEMTGPGGRGGAAAPQLQNLGKDFNWCFLPPLLISQYDVIIDDKGRNMIKNDENKKHVPKTHLTVTKHVK